MGDNIDLQWDCTYDNCSVSGAIYFELTIRSFYDEVIVYNSKKI